MISSLALPARVTLVRGCLVSRVAVAGGRLRARLLGADTFCVEYPAEVVAVSEPERSRALVRLGDRHAAEELSAEEFSRALDAVLGARTQGEAERASPDVGAPSLASDLGWRDAELLERHLPRGEKVLWTGRPDKGLAVPNAWIAARLAFVSIATLIVSLGNVNEVHDRKPEGSCCDYGGCRRAVRDSSARFLGSP